VNEIHDVIEGYKLPELPEEYDGEGSAQLVLFRQGNTSIPLADQVSITDAREYCRREDTHSTSGDWFVGYRLN
jgi:hypothetical protein